MEVDSSTDFGRLVDPDDGYLDEVHERRDALGADLVHMQLATGNVAIAGSAFSIGRGEGTFLHEIGHNFGIGHERGEFTGASGTGTYNYGVTTDSCRRTIMSYGTSCPDRTRFQRVPYYGSPWRYGPSGRMLGVSRFSKERGLHGPADAVLTLNRNRHRIANLRPSRNGG